MPKAASHSAALLAEADEALTAGELERARTLYQRLVREHPDAPEASAAIRALKIIGGFSGLLLTFITTPMIDKIPDDTPMVEEAAHNVSPAVIPVVGAHGRPGVAWGLTWSMP